MAAQNIKHDLADWMRQVLDENNWTAAEWARRANTSPTNITRFLKDLRYMPSGTTIDKLAGVVQLPAPLGNGKRLSLEGRHVPLVEKGAGIVDLNHHSKDHVVTMVPVGVDALAIYIDTDRFSLGGILPGDIVIFEPTHVREPEDNDLVVVLTSEGVEVGRVKEPLLLPHSSDPKHYPLELDKVDVVLGIAVEQVRRLR